MPVEEHKELRDLVTQTLQAKGVLQKVQAEIRASVFLALEEQDIFKEKSPFINQPLKEYVSSQEGLITISLVREFLEFFNLEFATMVFDPETHASTDYNYEGRSKIVKDLKLDIDDDNKVPLLGLLVKLLTSASKKSFDSNSSKNSSIKSDLSKGSENSSEHGEQLYSNGLNGSVEHKSQESDDIPSERLVDNEKSEEKSDRGKRVGIRKDNTSVTNNTSLTSLGNLPPLSKASPGTTLPAEKAQRTMKDLKALLDLEDGSNFEDDLPPNSNIKEKNAEEKHVSDESEIECEVSEVGSAPTDDNTIDVSISRDSGKADYLEDL